MRATALGRCPNCDATIPRRNKLIEYTTSEGWTAIYAECADCAEVVHPR